MFQPKYTVTNTLLARIAQIAAIMERLNNKRFPHLIKMEYAYKAQVLSSYASTHIEGNPLPLTEVKKILKSRPAHLRASEQEVINYNFALEYLQKQIQSGVIHFDLKLVRALQKIVTTNLLPEYHVGKLRQVGVVVNNPATGQIVYMAPDVQDVKPLLSELVQFVKENKAIIHTVILAGIFHKQFMMIHPFADGNGRTGRLLTKILLAALGLNTFNLFSFENYYNNHLGEYFEKVGERGDYYDLKEQIDFTQWLEFFAGGIIDELLRVENDLSQYALSPYTIPKEHDLLLLDHVRGHGYITDREYSQLVDRAKPTRTLDFKRLQDLGFIVRSGKGKATYYTLKE